MKKKEDPKANKKRVVKAYENLSPELLKQLNDAYPLGFADSMISFFDRDGKLVSALPFETDEIYYLIKIVEKKSKPVKEEEETDTDLVPEAAAESGEDDLFDDTESEESGGDVSLDEIENAENSFADDDNY